MADMANAFIVIFSWCQGVSARVMGDTRMPHAKLASFLDMGRISFPERRK